MGAVAQSRRDTVYYSQGSYNGSYAYKNEGVSNKWHTVS